MRITRSEFAGCVVLGLAGRLDWRTAPELRQALGKAVAEGPRAVVCDLAELEVADPVALSVFFRFAEREPGWPWTPVALCMASPRVTEALHRFGLDTQLAVRANLLEAVTHPDRVPIWRRLRRLPVTPQAPGIARGFVRAFVRDRELEERDPAQTAVLVTSELVTNAVRYGRGPITLYLSHQGDRIVIGVADANPERPRHLPPADITVRGRGLPLLDALTYRWGAVPQRDGGKLVWCLLLLDPPVPSPDLA